MLKSVAYYPGNCGWFQCWDTRCILLIIEKLSLLPLTTYPSFCIIYAFWIFHSFKNSFICTAGTFHEKKQERYLTDEIILRDKIEIVPVAGVVLSIEINLIHKVENGAKSIHRWNCPVIRRGEFPVPATPKESIYPWHLYLHQLWQRFTRLLRVFTAPISASRHEERVCNWDVKLK